VDGAEAEERLEGGHRRDAAVVTEDVLVVTHATNGINHPSSSVNAYAY
jgi:hypothetical protein